MVADTVGGVPSLRWKDNLIQGIAIAIPLVIGAVVGGVITGGPGGVLVGGFLGLIAGLLLSGTVLMVFGWKRTADTLKKTD